MRRKGNTTLSLAEKVFLSIILIIVTVSQSEKPIYALSNTEDITITGSGTVCGLGPTPEHVDNYGNIAATATGLDAYAYGIYATGSVNNSGNIRAMATGSGIFTHAFGIFSDAGVTNTRNINATATSNGGSPAIADVYAIRTAGAVNNSGNITAVAIAMNSVSMDNANARGIWATGNVNNSGNITATACTTSSNATTSSAYAIGITSSGVTTNSGNIFATAIANGNFTARYAYVYGMLSSGGAYNSGNITATAIGSSFVDARGISASSGTIINSGNISVNATTISEAYAYGIDVGSSSTIIKNSGNITATAIGTYAYAYGVNSRDGSTITNSGNITVTANGPYANTYGILFQNGGALTNTGVIRTPGNNGYEVFISGGTVNLLNRYNMTLDGSPTKGSIYVLGGGGGTLSLNNALLSATAVPDTRFNTQYRIFEGTGTVNGVFGGVLTPKNPAVSVLYHNQGTPGSSDDTVSLVYHPKTSPILQGIHVSRHLLSISLDPAREQEVDGFLGRLFSVRPTQLAAAGNVASDAPNNLVKHTPQDNIYFVPSYAGLRNDSDSTGYDAKLAGFAAGYVRRFNLNQFGFHLGYGCADINFSGNEFPSDTEEEQNITSLGVGGMGRIDNWTLRGDVTGFYGRHDYTGISGANFEAKEEAKFNSWGTTESIMAGYIFKVGENRFFPEVGLNHTWLRQESFSTSASPGGWQTDYSAVKSNQIQVLATMRWLGRFSLKGTSFTPSIAIGGRYRITNDDLTVRQSVPGSSPVAVAVNQERTVATSSISLCARNGNLLTTLAYNGEYSGHTTLHGAWLKFLYVF